MEVEIRKKRNRSMHVHLDEEAAHTMLSSVTFASRFHAEIASPTKITEQRLDAKIGQMYRTRRHGSCH